ncbi:MAG: MFS transporter [Bacilli bacterium]|jgi:GPH family glycoside/pentoside/hexuronide:cation symporter
MEKVKSTLKEKLFYGFGNMGSYILWSFISANITVYVTYVLNFSADYLSLFGAIILACRFFDGVSDIIMGIIIEKTHSKLGKARFWYGISILPLTVSFFCIFLVSGLDMKTSLIVIAILYFLFKVIFYTANNVSFNAELPTLSNDSYDQSNICTVNSVFTSVGSLAVALSIPILNGFGGKDKESSWLYLVAILVVIAVVGEVLSFIKIKEKKEIQAKAKETMSKSDLHKGIKILLTSKYFYLAIAMFAINYYLSLSVSSVGVYYAEFVLGNDNYSSLFASLPMISMGIGLLLTPFLVKKIGKKTTLSMAIGCVFLGNLIGSCFPFSLAAGLTGSMIKGLGLAIVMSQLFTLAPDLVQYVYLKYGLRIEGLAASANSFGSKVVSGLGSAVVLWTLAGCGYISEKGATKPDSAIYSFITIYWWVPAILALVLLIFSLFWDIQKKTDQLEKEQANKTPAHDSAINN